MTRTVPGPPAARRGSWQGLWGRAQRKPLVVLAGVMVLAVVVIVTVLVVQALMGALPSGNRVTLNRTDATGATAPSTRAWYDRTTAEGLVAELDAATEATDWCLGWRIVQQYSYGSYNVSGSALVDYGSSRGLELPATTCTNWAEVVVLYGYTSSSGRYEDNAELWVEVSDPALGTRLNAHDAFRVSSDDLLHEDRGDGESDVIGNAIAALPLALADEGEIDPLTVEPVGEGEDGGVAFDDREGWGGSDAWRTERSTIAAGAIVALLGLAGLCLAAVRLVPRPPALNPRRALKAQLAATRPAPPSSAPPAPPATTTSEETT